MTYRETDLPKKVEEAESALELSSAKATLPGSLVEQILLSQPLNPLVKCEFEIMPRSVS